MCDPVTAGLIITAVAGGVSTVNQQRALKKQDREVARGIREQGEIQRESNRRVNEQIDELAGATGEAEQAAALSDFQQAIRSGREQTEGSTQDVVGASDRFAERVGDARASVRGEGQEQAERLSVIDGILRQRIGEGQDIGRTESDLTALRNTSNAADFLTRLRASEIRPNPWVDLAAGIAGGVGSGMAMRPPTTTTPTTTPKPKTKGLGPFGGPI